MHVSLFSRSAGKPELYQNEMLLVLLAYQTNFDCCSSTPTITTHLNILSILLGRLICRTLSDTRTRCPYNTQCCIARHTLNHRVCGIFHTDGGIFFCFSFFLYRFFLCTVVCAFTTAADVNAIDVSNTTCIHIYLYITCVLLFIWQILSNW